MIAAYLLVLGLLSCSNGDLMNDLASPLIQSLGPSLYYMKSGFRSKREIVTKPLDDPGNCITTCAAQLNSRLYQLQNATLLSNASESEKLLYLCQAFVPTSPCFHACPPSQLAKLVEDFLPVMSLICNLGDENYPELLQSLNCINGTKDQVEEKCNKKCEKEDFHLGGATLENTVLRKNTTVHINLLPNFVIYDDNKTENAENLKVVCSYLTCVDDCDDIVIKPACGSQANLVQDKLISTIVHAIVALFKDVDAIDNIPEECKKYNNAKN